MQCRAKGLFLGLALSCLACGNYDDDNNQKPRSDGGLVMTCDAGVRIASIACPIFCDVEIPPNKCAAECRCPDSDGGVVFVPGDERTF